MSTKLTFTALLLLASGVAVAADINMYSDLDINQDGAISKKEAVALPGLSKSWVELDQNADGMLDQAEFAKFEAVEMSPGKGETTE